MTRFKVLLLKGSLFCLVLGKSPLALKSSSIRLVSSSDRSPRGLCRHGRIRKGGAFTDKISVEAGKTFDVYFEQLNAFADAMPSWDKVVVAYESQYGQLELVQECKNNRDHYTRQVLDEMSGRRKEALRKRKEANAYQVFDRMPLKRKEMTEKSKKRKLKVTKPRNQSMSGRRQCQRLNCRRLCLILLLNKRFQLGFMKKKEEVGAGKTCCLELDTLSEGKKSEDEEQERGSFTKSKGWKHKAKEDKSATQTLQTESVSTLDRKRVTERHKGVSCVLVNTHQIFNRQWLLSFIEKKKGQVKLVYNKKSMKLFHTRDFAELACDVTVVKQKAKGKRKELKRNYKKQKKWIKKLFSAFLWSDQGLQLNVLVKLSRQWLLAADKFGVYKRCGYENIYKWEIAGFSSMF
nr:PREDICTED: uncharacterized protein LOC108854572 [Raphanus sativus]